MNVSPINVAVTSQSRNKNAQPQKPVSKPQLSLQGDSFNRNTQVSFSGWLNLFKGAEKKLSQKQIIQSRMAETFKNAQMWYKDGDYEALMSTFESSFKSLHESFGNSKNFKKIHTLFMEQATSIMNTISHNTDKNVQKHRQFIKFALDPQYASDTGKLLDSKPVKCLMVPSSVKNYLESLPDYKYDGYVKDLLNSSVDKNVFVNFQDCNPRYTVEHGYYKRGTNAHICLNTPAFNTLLKVLSD